MDDCQFSIRNKEHGTRNSKCKECHKKYIKLHYRNNKAKYILRSNINNKIRYEKLQENICKYL